MYFILVCIYDRINNKKRMCVILKKFRKKLKGLDFKNNKYPTILYFTLRILVIFLMIYNITQGRYENAFTCLLVLFLLLLPFIMEEKVKLEFSSSLEIVILLFIFCAEILGEVNAWYQRIPNFDTLMHTITGFIMGAVGFSLVNMVNNSERAGIKLNPKYLLVASFCFSMTIGVLWEFFEFGVDQIFHADMQKDTYVSEVNSVMFDETRKNEVVNVKIDSVMVNGEVWPGYLDIGLIDTMKDLIVNAIGAITFSVIGYITISKNNGETEKLIVIKKKDDIRIIG